MSNETNDAEPSGASAGSRGPDITKRLRRWVHAVEVVAASDLIEEAADEIERLRLAISRIADQDATLSVCNGNVTVTMDATLTRYERHCIERVRDIYADEDDVACNEIAAVLDGLLDRTK